MSSLADMVAALWGSSAEAAPSTVVPAPALKQYPTPDDAEYARKYGFGYESPNAAYVQGDVARVLGGVAPGATNPAAYVNGKAPLRPFVPRSAAGLLSSEASAAGANEGMSRNLDLTDPSNLAVRDKVGGTLTQAALAANRSPIAALGYDPRQAALDVVMSPNSTVGGSYNRKTDSIYANNSDPSAILHESIHRGLSQLRKNPELSKTFEALPSEESVVRYLMASKAGDPEGGGGSIDKQQRDAGLYAFEKSLMGTTYSKSLKLLEEAAQREIARRKPGGPN